MKTSLITLIFSAISIMSAAREIHGASADTIGTTHRLSEVVVKADDVTITPDKMMIRVDNKVKKHSYDGYSALSLLSIPGVNVDLFSSTVTANGSNVLLCINGLEATNDEIKTLNPKSIIRIDYYNHYDPEHPTADYVLNFIVKVRDSGGEMMLQGEQLFDHEATGATADWRTFFKKSELGVRFNTGYERYHPSRLGESVRSMDFSSGEVIKYSRGLSMMSRDNKLAGTVTFLHRTLRGVVKAAVSLTGHHLRSDNTDEVEYVNSPFTGDITRTLRHTDQLYPAFQVSYDHKFASKASLQLSLKGRYTHTDGSRGYYADDDYMSTTRENYYRINPQVRLTMPFGRKVSAYAVVRYFYDNSRQRYTENGVMRPSRLVNGQGMVETGANFKFTKRLNVAVRLQERIVTTDAGDGYKTDCYFTPALNATYNIDRSNQLRGAVNMGVYDPQLSHYSTDEKRVDEYLVKTGNPELKLMRPIAGQLMWTSVHRWGNLQVGGMYENTSHAIYPDYTCDDVRGVYIQTYKNGGHYEKLTLTAGVQLNIIPDCLKFSADVMYNHDKLRGRLLHEKDGVKANGKLTFMQSGFSCQLSAETPVTSMDRYGSYMRSAAFWSVMGGYSVNSWSFNMLCQTPFRRCQRTWSEYTGYSMTSRYYSPGKQYGKIGIMITYRFDYGKRHKYEEIKLDSSPGSAILSH